MLHFSNLVCVVASYSWHHCLDFASLWAAPLSIAYTNFLLTLTLHIGFTLTFTPTLTKNPLCYFEFTSKIHTTKKKLQNWESGVTEFQTFTRRELVCLTLPSLQSLITENSTILSCTRNLVTYIFCYSVLYFLFVTSGIRTLKKVYFTYSSHYYSETKIQK